ncbi:MAG: MmgE/PrpD family protein [Armatimonadota bacterium]|nr:MmgE/PrpD family protein [Armatimonadota bacterium]MDR7538694.1 MmgE/PrpD family protein [Armatimonadota bacterium]
MSQVSVVPGYTRQLAEFITQARVDAFPPEAVERVKLHLLDALGIMLGAYATRHPVVDGVLRLAREATGRAEATLVGTGEKVACAEAAMANAVLANFLDFSDGHFMGGHINDRLVPVCLAVGERSGASGREVLAALLLGYEVYIHLAATLFAAVEAGSVRLPYFVVVGALAGAAAAGRLLRLSADQVAGALGLAASFQLAGAQYVHSGGQEKDLCPGHEARRAVISALLAQRGVLGSVDILEGERGLLRLVGADLPPEGAADLGRRWRMTECYLKPYPACRYLHASIEAALKLHAQGVDPAEVESVTVTTNSSSAARTCYHIRSHVNAIFSHPYQLAVALVEGKTDLPTAWAAKLQDPRIADLLPRVRVRATAAYNELHRRRSLSQPPWPAEVEVVLRDGRRLTAGVRSPRGDPGNPLTVEEVEEKFTTLAGRALSRKGVSRLREAVHTLEALPHIGGLTSLLAADLG